MFNSHDYKNDYFEEENSTPNDIAELLADLVFKPVADRLENGGYTCYDGCCGTGKLLTVARERLNTLAAEKHKGVSVRLFGQECNGEAYARCISNLSSEKGSGQADQIVQGSALSADGFSSCRFDFMFSDTSFLKSRKSNAEKKHIKTADSRFNACFKNGEAASMLPQSADSQLLFLLNSVSKMKNYSPLGSRIAEIHTVASLNKGEAGSGESNARRYLIENDLVEAIIALPKNTLYSTGVGSYIWILSNRKDERRRGKIQLINASDMKLPARVKIGKKKYELTAEIREEIVRIFLAMEENDRSHVIDNSELGFWCVTVNRPLRQRVTVNVETIRETVSMFNTLYGVETQEDDTPVVAPADIFSFTERNPTVRTVKMPKTAAEIEMKMIYDMYMTTLMDFVREEPYMDYNNFIDKFYSHPIIKNNKTRLKRFENFMYPLLDTDPSAKVVLKDGLPVFDPDLQFTASIPLSYAGGVKGFIENEVLPHSPDAWINEDRVRIGYEIHFNE